MNEKLMKIEGKLNEIKSIESYIDILKKQVLQEQHIKIGDIVEVNGFAHKGKTMKIITMVIIKHWNNKWKVICRGHVYKKDGSLGVQVGEYMYFIE